MPTAVPGLVCELSVSVSVSPLPDAAGRIGRRHDLRKAEVEDLDLSARRHKDVGGLDVAVDDSPGVRGIERARRSGRPSRGAAIRFERTGGDAVLERRAIEQLHGDERPALVLVDVENGADVGVVQGGGGARLPLEAVQRLRHPGRRVQAGT